jgi:hypothetical protein
VQICGVVRESQVPAQASPLLEMVKTAVLLERNETGVVMVTCLLFCGVAVKVWFAVPTSIETMFVGARMMLAGTGKTVFLVGLLLLQLVNAAIKLTAISMRADRAIIKEEDDLPIDPPRPVISARRARLDSFWKAPSVEARIFFSKLSRFAGVRARRRNPERSEGSGVLI